LQKKWMGFVNELQLREEVHGGIVEVGLGIGD
jgi:hypothetical protein